MPPVAATLPAVSEDSEVTSISPTSPASAIGWPSRPISSTAFAFASRCRRWQTSAICCCSSGNITSGLIYLLDAFTWGSETTISTRGASLASIGNDNG